MLLNFKQGIIQAAPGFIAAGGQYVSLVISGTPVSYTICSSIKNYTYVEQESVNAAWGPIYTGIDQWLYWDINTLTAARTFGVTLWQPVVGGTAPIAPAIDQHWFDTTTQEMKVWSGTTWSVRLRVFACKLSNGAVPQSMSINAPDFTGTQAGITAPEAIFATGEILFDAQTGQPLRVGTGYFATTVDPLTTASLSSESIIISTAIIPAQLTANVGASSVVEFTDYQTVSPANQFTASLGKVYGMVTEGSLMGQTVNVITSGPVTNDLWDFSMPGAGALEPGMPPFVRFPDPCPVNTPLYSTSTGELTAVSTGQVPVAIVTGKNSIIMGSPQIRNTGGTNNLATTSTYGLVRLNIPPASPGVPIVVGDNDPRLVNAGDISGKVNRSGDAMTGILALVGDPVDPLDSTPKQYVDAGDLALSNALVAGLATKLDIAGGTMLGSLTLNADPVNPLEAATKQYVDGVTTGFVPLAGGTMSGYLVLNADPFAPLQSATKQYVDAAVAAVTPVEPNTWLVYGTGTGISASSTLSYDATDGTFTLSPSPSSSPGNVSVFAPSGISNSSGGDFFVSSGAGNGIGAGGTVSIQAGTGGITGSGGNIFLAAGQGGATSGNGGSVNIIAGTNPGAGSAGNITLTFPPAGTLQINGDAGTAGQVLTSNGPATAPTWQTAPGVSVPVSIADGGTGLTSITSGLTLLSADITGTSLLYRNVFGQGGISVFWSDTPLPQVTVANQPAAKFEITKATTDGFTVESVGGSFYDMYEWNMDNVGLTLDLSYNGGSWILGPFSFPVPGSPIGPLGVNLNDLLARSGVWTTQFNLQFTSAFSGFPVGSFMTVFASSLPAFGYLREFTIPVPVFTLADGGNGPSTSFTCTLPNLPGGTSNILWKVRLFVPTTGSPDPTLQPLAGSMTLVWAA